MAQLIFDLKQVNRAAGVVKLVAEPASARCRRCRQGLRGPDHISGYDGGTGASPLSSSSTPARPGSWAGRNAPDLRANDMPIACACRPTAVSRPGGRHKAPSWAESFGFAPRPWCAGRSTAHLSPEQLRHRVAPDRCCVRSSSSPAGNGHELFPLRGAGCRELMASLASAA